MRNLSSFVYIYTYWNPIQLYITFPFDSNVNLVSITVYLALNVSTMNSLTVSTVNHQQVKTDYNLIAFIIPNHDEFTVLSTLWPTDQHSVLVIHFFNYAAPHLTY